MTRIVGLDLSLTATGVAWEGGTGLVKSKLTGMPRLAEICDDIVQPSRDVDLVVIEGYSFGSHNAHAHALGELGGVVRLDLWRHNIPHVDVPPATLKKFATGKGNAGKDEVLAAAIRSFGFAGSNNNEADAYMLRQMGLAHYDGMANLSIARTEALSKVDWPTL
jgi:Holliday junction resolvasome RuvABC endonuclease subunit